MKGVNNSECFIPLVVLCMLFGLHTICNQSNRVTKRSTGLKKQESYDNWYCAPGDYKPKPNLKVQERVGNREYYDNWYCGINDVNKGMVHKPTDKMNMDELELFLQTGILDKLKAIPYSSVPIQPLSQETASDVSRRFVIVFNNFISPLRFLVTRVVPVGQYNVVTSSSTLYKLKLLLTEVTKFFQFELLVLVDGDGYMADVATTTSKKFDTFVNKISDMTTLYSNIGDLSTSDAFETSLERMTAAHTAKQAMDTGEN